MAINGSEIRDISRVLHISADVVIETLKKENWNWQVNLAYIKSHKNVSKIAVELVCVKAVEMDESGHMSMIRSISVGFGMQSIIKRERFLRTRLVRGNIMFWRRLLLLLKPFSIDKVYVDGNYAYEKLLGADKILVGKGIRGKLSVSICRCVLG
ncbi:MAG: hypothetical protein FWB84_05200 [Candidatus Bathyarchaeota archaeon]|jgi:hypothetical protein|uniref:hypothetical protein n=1 Tax=Candidatus Bathycorpusculum sp. TaxID=2994959 RepID=UPI002828BE56|nr:hypothetical protein [Candidatus Termiticorpusculum sp.]MCL2257423.1 hypothetical protein [Candidatus Termiticorpusculum sp.]MCL2292419.1 hypothetical protein [Candidatus Termiticorpusculum sp.]